MLLKILPFLMLFGFGCNISNANNKIKVAIVDTGLDFSNINISKHLCPSGHEDFTGEGIKDVNGHGTHVAGLVIQNAKNANYCLIILKFYTEKASNIANTENSYKAFEKAIKLKVNIVNFSAGGNNGTAKEANLIYHNPQTLFIVAAGNKGKELNVNDYFYFPASYDYTNIISVGNLQDEDEKNPSSNYGKVVDAWEIGTNTISEGLNNVPSIMTGTSMAAAVYTGKIINKLND